MSSVPNEGEMQRRPACDQCGRPAIYSYEIDKGGQLCLCLDCATKYESIRQEKWQRDAALLNYVLAQFGMTTGIQLPQIRTQPRSIQVTAGNTLNNIQVTNSNIGVLNTGHIHTIDSAIGIVSSAGDSEVANALKALTEAVANSTEATKAQKDELLELLSLIATEAAVPRERRKSKGIWPIISQTGSILSGLNALSSLWTKYAPAITSFFGLP